MIATVAMVVNLSDVTLVANAEQSLDFIGDRLESSTAYSITGQGLDGRILLGNEGARRLCDEPEEMNGKEVTRELALTEKLPGQIASLAKSQPGTPEPG